MGTRMDPNHRWLLLLLTLIPAWEVACSQNCSVSPVLVVPVNTTALKVDWIIPEDFDLIFATLDGITIRTNDSKTDLIFNNLQPGVVYTVHINVTYTNCTFKTVQQGTTNPSPVADLSLLSRTTDGLTISWNAPNETRASNYTYNIKVTSDTDAFNKTYSTVAGATMFTATGLSPGVQYNLRVESVTPENTISVPQNLEDTTNPSPVTDLSLVSRTTDGLTISWKAPNETRASNYTYNITVTSDTGAFNKTYSTVAGATMFTATGLSPGVQYNLRVESVTPENTISVPQNLEDTTNPSPVTDLSLVSRTTDGLTISWKAPNETRASNYTYNITVTSDTGAFNKTYSTVAGATMFTATGLSPGVQYNLRVESVTPENTISAPQNLEGTTNPSPITDLSLVNRTTDGLTISWKAPNDTRASNYTYNIKVTSDTGTFNKTYSTAAGATMFTATGLSPGVQYNLRVESVTPENTISAPQNLEDTTNPSPVTDLSLVNRTTDGLTISWKAPNDTRASNYRYDITVTSDTGAFNKTYSTVAGATMFTATGLSPGVQYNLRVESVTPENTISAPQNLEGTTNPSPITDLSLVNRTTDGLTISWKAPNDTRASNYTYNIKVTSDTGTFNKTYSTVAGATMFTATGLSPGVQYNLRVESVTPENTISAPQNLEDTTNPSPITDLSLVNRTTDGLTISWKAPNDTRASNYTYNIKVTSDTGTFNKTYSTAAGATMFTATGLSPGVQYNLRVESVTPENTISAPQNLEDTTNPSPVTDLSLVNRTTDGLTISWKAPNDTRASNYRYDITVTSDTGAFNKTYSTGAGVTEFTATGLSPGVQYNLRVESVTPENTISAPQNLEGTTIPDVASKIRCVQETGHAVEVEWNKPRGNFTGFNVSSYDGTHLLTVQAISANKCLVKIENLQPGRQYTIDIYTRAGQSYSEKVTVQCWTSLTPIIIGAVVGSLLGLLLIGLLLFFIITKSRPRRKQPDSEFSPMSTISSEFKPIPVGEYESYFQDKHADSDFGFAEEYQSLSNVGTEQSKKAAQDMDNKGKNRYINVLPYDATRVNLTPQLDSSTSDYINANYMPGYKIDKEFIAAQGPLPSTVVDFWRMIWEQKSEVIVMLTNCVELNRVKCEHYWPLDYTPCTYGDITVTVTSENILPEWTLRKFIIKEAGHSDTRIVSHLHFTAWPDHGVPETTEKLIEFRQLIRNHLNSNQRGSPVIHCSAGVGRTGTLIALDCLLQQIQQEGVVDVYGIVHRMRLHRPLMVQTEPQYVFLHQCILDTIQSKQPEEAIYQNQQDLVYENVSAITAANRHPI
ncbi:receptor-type tyrosine-protein phosphatase H-like isoform X2 [Heptranchias perlo]|uniref:receptor-type tyrosine-protein phosphatase H-like isoform X2 n=1 Tax=Heptranchias perlo TaxID=212740 RepID=UPI00355A2CA7